MTEEFYEGYDNGPVVFEVEYYKTSGTRFFTKYEHPDGYEVSVAEDLDAEAVAAASDGWNTYTVNLTAGIDHELERDYRCDGWFTNDESNHKYAIGLTTVDGYNIYATGEVYIRSIKVIKTAGAAVRSEVDTQNNTGLMFWNDEKIEIPLSLKNITEKTQTVDVSVIVRDYSASI